LSLSHECVCSLDCWVNSAVADWSSSKLVKGKWLTASSVSSVRC
jgi:hypothetical protein